MRVGEKRNTQEEAVINGSDMSIIFLHKYVTQLFGAVVCKGFCLSIPLKYFLKALSSWEFLFVWVIAIDSYYIKIECEKF